MRSLAPFAHSRARPLRSLARPPPSLARSPPSLTRALAPFAHSRAHFFFARTGAPQHVTTPPPPPPAPAFASRCLARAAFDSSFLLAFAAASSAFRLAATITGVHVSPLDISAPGPMTAKFIICNAQFLVFSTQCLVFSSTKFLVFKFKIPCFQCKIDHFYLPGGTTGATVIPASSAAALPLRPPARSALTISSC